MNSEWPNVKLGDCIELVTGFPFKSAKYTDAQDAIRLLRGDNVGQGVLRWDGAKMWPPEDSRELAHYELNESDVVLAMDRPWIPAGLKFARVRKSDLPALLVQRVARFRPKDCIRADYLYSVIGSREFTEYIQNVTTGTAVPHISAKQIRDFPFKLPDIRTQELVGQFLANLDDRITLLRETNGTLEAIAQALFKSWFVDFDPVCAKQEGAAPEGMNEASAALFPDGFEESRLGLVPRGWRVGALGDVAETIRSQLQPDEMDRELDYVGLEHIPRKCLSLYEWGRAEGLESAKFRFDEGDVLFGKLRPYFHKVVVAPTSGVCSTDILVCKPSTPSLYGFVVLQLFSSALISYADRLSNGAKMPRVNWKDLAAYELVIPPTNIAAVFTTTVQPMLSLMKENALRMQTLVDLRGTLLPRLISGQLRLPEVEALVA